jgi:hypothetical protein
VREMVEDFELVLRIGVGGANLESDITLPA